MTTLVNGQETDQLPATDRGLQYGDGVFETIAMQSGKPLLWDRHLARLAEGCRRLGLAPPDGALLRQELDRIAGQDARAVAKIILTRGVSGHGYRPPATQANTRIVRRLTWPSYPTEAARDGVTARWCATRLARQPLLTGIKHLNRLEQVLARAEWQDEYTEGLMRDTDDLVIEGTRTNLFLVLSDGTLATPDLSQSGVAGVMRAQVLDSLAALGLACRVGTVNVAMVESARELFLTNSLIGLWPVRQLEAKHYVVGPVAKKIQATLQEAGCVA
jgi:4-amino-4-deoxychorismate lyase